VQDTGAAYHPLLSVYMLDSTKGWAVGDSGTILHYDGKKWIKQDCPVKADLSSVCFVDENNGWAVGNDLNSNNDWVGIILKYDGKEWSVQKSYVGWGFNSVYFTDLYNGWAVGGDFDWGIILKYSFGYTVSGQLLYGGRADKPLAGVTVYLVDKEGVRINKTVSDSAGAYKFEFIEPGDYSLQCETKESWGGSDPVDALLCNKYFLRMYNFDSALHKAAADVNADNIVNPIDALYINRRFIHLLDKFNKADWLFQNPQFTITNSEIKLNINAICTGDPNASK